MKLVIKITNKELCGGDVKTAPMGYIGRVVGSAVGIRSGVKQFGDKSSEWHCLTGRFRAVNSNGEEFDSPQWFCPPVVCGLVKAELQNSPEIAVAFDIGKKESKTAPVGYEFTVEPVMQPSADDPLARLLADSIKSKPLPKALPKPKA